MAEPIDSSVVLKEDGDNIIVAGIRRGAGGDPPPTAAGPVGPPGAGSVANHATGPVAGGYAANSAADNVVATVAVCPVGSSNIITANGTHHGCSVLSNSNPAVSNNSSNTSLTNTALNNNNTAIDNNNNNSASINNSTPSSPNAAHNLTLNGHSTTTNTIGLASGLLSPHETTATTKSDYTTTTPTTQELFMPDYIETFWPNKDKWSAAQTGFTPTPLFESPVESTIDFNGQLDTFQNLMLGAFPSDGWDAAEFTTQSCPVARLLSGYDAGNSGNMAPPPGMPQGGIPSVNNTTNNNTTTSNDKQLDTTPMSAFIQQLEEDAAADLVASLLRQQSSTSSNRGVVTNLPSSGRNKLTPNWPILNNGQQQQQPLVNLVEHNNNTKGGSLEEGTRKNSTTTLSREPSIAELRGRVLALAKVQYGSRLLQRLLARGSHIDLILNETLEELPALMTDAYGNYLCQQLFEVCTPSQRRQILTRLGPCAAQIAEDRRGTHSMQALIGLVGDETEELLLLEGMLRSDILALSTHPHATHVIQRALTACGLKVKSMIFEPVIQRLSDVARTPHGICVVKRCISAASADAGCEVFRAPLLKKLTAAAVPLIQSPYGNYAIQHALDAFGAELCRPILRQVWDNFLMLSTQKFSSNVVEKSIAVSSDADVSKLLRLATESQVLKALLASSYGSFVIQKLLTRVEDDEAERVLGLLVNSNVELANKRIRAKFERLLCSLAERLRYNGDALVAVAGGGGAAAGAATAAGGTAGGTVSISGGGGGPTNNANSTTTTNTTTTNPPSSIAQNNTEMIYGNKIMQSSNESISNNGGAGGGGGPYPYNNNNTTRQPQQQAGWLTFRTGTASTSATNSPPPSEWENGDWNKQRNRAASGVWSPEQPQRRNGRGKRWRGGRRGGGGGNNNSNNNNSSNKQQGLGDTTRFDLKGIIEA